jgi:predicted dinucleotide-binding enzyme
VRIAVIGRGRVGGSLAELWRQAGHDVEELGRGGGDVSGADVVLLAVPPAAIPDALASAGGVAGKVVVDATNHVSGERPSFPSLAHQVQSITGGPVAKAFNLNFASIHDRAAEASSPPGAFYCADDGARAATERLIRDAGYEPIDAGPLDNARALEDALRLLFGVSQAGGGPFFYRVERPASR